MFIYNFPILQVVDAHTNFQNAPFLRLRSTQEIRNACKECCLTVYIGYTNILRLDREASFTSSAFCYLASLFGIELHPNGLVPSLVDFGKIPVFPFPKKTPLQPVGSIPRNEKFGRGSSNHLCINASLAHIVAQSSPCNEIFAQSRAACSHILGNT